MQKIYIYIIIYILLALRNWMPHLVLQQTRMATFIKASSRNQINKRSLTKIEWLQILQNIISEQYYKTEKQKN